MALCRPVAMTVCDPSLYTLEKNRNEITTSNRLPCYSTAVRSVWESRMWDVGCGMGATGETTNTPKCMKEARIHILRLPIPIVVVIIILVLDRNRWRCGIRFHYNPQSASVTLQITTVQQ